jgi:EAL domain-containing protein (putative c-di-GMP-specific phosphodiesterase class I)/GGDEF domain-containing protein
MYKIARIIAKLESSKKSKTVFYLLIFSVLPIGLLVYKLGGTPSVMCHMMYLPIIMSAILFDVNRTLFVAFFATFTLGPFMPLNVSENIMQTTGNWLARGFFFMGIGLFASLSLKYIKLSIAKENIKYHYNTITKLPNTFEFKSDLSQMIKSNKYSNINILVFEFENTDDLIRYISYDTAHGALIKLLESSFGFFGKHDMYSIYTNEFAIILPDCAIEEAFQTASRFLSSLDKSVVVDGIPVPIEIRGGIVSYPIHGNEVNNLTQKLGRTLAQAKREGEKLSIYNQELSNQQVRKIKTVISLYSAIENNEFILFYQPKINPTNNSIDGLEALLRWDNDENINIEETIKIAEEIGFISEITKWVIKNAIEQIKKWQDDKIDMRVSVNISAFDLKDDSIIEYTKKHLDNNDIDPSKLEFEITERMLIQNEKNALYLIKKIKAMGLTLSIDDYGTGYNSLKNLVTYPFNYIKIDKYFIDTMMDGQNRILLRSVFSSLHALRLKIIAEGVETKAQVDALIEMGCDSIQGYYYSKPLSAKEIEVFIHAFNNKTQN